MIKAARAVLTPLLPVLAAVSAGLAAVSAGLAAWHWQDLRLGRQLSDLRSAHATAQARAAADAAQQRIDYETQLSEALYAHQHRQETLAADLAASRTAVDLLRHTATTLRAELDTRPQAAAVDAAATSAQLLADCSAAHQQLAGAADGHVADVQLMRAAWPAPAAGAAP